MNIENLLLRVPSENLSEPGKLAVEMLEVIFRSNPDLDTATEAADIVHSICRYGRSTTPVRETAFTESDAEYLMKRLTQKLI